MVQWNTISFTHTKKKKPTIPFNTQTDNHKDIMLMLYFLYRFNANKEEQKQLVDDKAYRDGNKLLPPPNEAGVVSVEAALGLFTNAIVFCVTTL